MTTARTAPLRSRPRLPDPPEREPDEVTSFDHLHQHGNAHYLALHFGQPETTLVAADRWIAPHPNYGTARLRRPDLLIAFDVDPELYRANNGYIVSEQGKPPDFVLEIASKSTGSVDTGEKRDDYAALGIAEYWRFDETGEYHGARLAGDRLVAGRYEPILISEPEPDVLEGYSAALNLHLRWERGRLAWHDPQTGRHITTFESVDQARLEAEVRADEQGTARLQAEARVRELEAELQRLRDPSG